MKKLRQNLRQIKGKAMNFYLANISINKKIYKICIFGAKLNGKQNKSSLHRWGGLAQIQNWLICVCFVFAKSCSKLIYFKCSIIRLFLEPGQEFVVNMRGDQDWGWLFGAAVYWMLLCLWC